MKKISKIISAIVRCSVVLGFSFIWINYYNRQFSSSLIFALILTTSLEAIIQLYTSHKNHKLQLSKTEEQKLVNVANQLTYGTTSLVFNYYANLLKTKYCSQKYSDCIVVINDHKICVIPMHKPSSINSSDVNYAYKIALNHKCTHAIILTNSIDTEAQKLIKSITSVTIDTLDIYEVYNTLIKPYGAEPNFNVNISTPKTSKQDLLNIAFNRKRTKSYLLSGFVLIFASLFTPYNIYYVVMSSLLLGCALFSYFNTPYNKPTKKDLLWLSKSSIRQHKKTKLDSSFCLYSPAISHCRSYHSFVRRFGYVDVDLVHQ